MSNIGAPDTVADMGTWMTIPITDRYHMEP